MEQQLHSWVPLPGGLCRRTHRRKQIKQELRLGGHAVGNLCEDRSGASAEGSEDRYDLIRA